MNDKDTDRFDSITDRFLGFVGNAGHKATEMFDATINTLQEFEFNIMNCREQSYDTASNMSGIYNGLQAKISAKIHWSTMFLVQDIHSTWSENTLPPVVLSRPTFLTRCSNFTTFSR